MKKWLPVQKIIWNLYFLFVYRILHQKIFQKNQSKGIHRDKKNKQDLLLSSDVENLNAGWLFFLIFLSSFFAPACISPTKRLSRKWMLVKVLAYCCKTDDF